MASDNMKPVPEVMASKADNLDTTEKMATLDSKISSLDDFVVAEQFMVDPKAERALVWKFDLRLLPVLAVMYLFNSLDKSNLGNAKTAGLEKSLGLVGDQYNIILSVFFVPYVLTGKQYSGSAVSPFIRVLRSTNCSPFPRHIGQEVRPKPSPSLHDVRVWLLYPAGSGDKEFRWNHDYSLVLGHERVGLLSARHLLPDHVGPSQPTSSS